MKTVKEIALKLNVSHVTVYNHIKKLDKELKGSIFKKKGVTYLDDEGIKQIKISMGLIQVPEVQKNVSMENIIDDISLKITQNVKEDIDELKKQLQELKDQSNILIELIKDKQRKPLSEKIKGIFKKS